MTKEEMQKRLSDAGQPVDKRWSEKTLQEKVNKLPSYTEEEIQNIISDVRGDHVKPIEEMTMKLDRTGEHPVTPGGIAVPWSVLSHMSKTKWNYFARPSSDVCAVYRMMYNGREEFVREYRRDIHGDTFQALADQFVKKNNA